MNEQILYKNPIEYISSVEAARLYSVTNDYVARLCRQGKVQGVLQAGTWLVERPSLDQFFNLSKKRPEERGEKAQFISSREAANLYRVTHDYISRLCRQRKLEGVLQGRLWLVEKKSLEQFFGPIKTPTSSTSSVGSNTAPLVYYLEQSPIIQKESATSLPKILPEQLIQPSKHFTYTQLGIIAAVGIILFSFSAYAAQRLGSVGGNEAGLADSIQSDFFGSPNSFATVFGEIHNFFFGTSNNSQLATSQTPPIQPSPTPTLPTLSVQESTTPAANPPQTQTTQPSQIIQNITQPVIERTVVQIQSGITQADLTSQLAALSSSLQQRIYQNQSFPNSLPATGGYQNEIALAQNISNLSGVTITGSTISSTSLNNVSGNFTGTVTSINTATTTFAAGIDLSSGCFSVNGICINTGGTGGGGSSSDINWAYFNNSAIALSTSTNQVLIGSNATTSLASLEVDGSVPLSAYFKNAVGIGTTSPFTTFGVNGSGYFAGALTASNIAATGTITVSGLATLSNLLVDASSTLSNFTAQNATTTSFSTNTFSLSGNYFTSLLGTGLSNQAGVLTISTTSLGLFASSSLSAGAGISYNPTTDVITNTIGYLFPSNATSTLLGFNGGFTSFASSTIGTGAQASGLTINGGATTTGNAVINGTLSVTGSGTSTLANNLMIGAANSNYYPNAPLILTTNTNNYGQLVMQNLNSGPSASTDIIVGADQMTDSSYYGDLGYNSSTNSGPFAPDDVYLYSSDSNLDLAAASTTGPSAINFYTGGTAGSNIRASISSSGLLTLNNGLSDLSSTTIGNSTQTGGLTISGGSTTTLNAYFAGDVGIGTTTPSTFLDVGGINTGELAQFGDGIGANQYISVNNLRSFFGFNNSTSRVVVQGNGGKGIEFDVNSNTFGQGTAAIITSAGLVGIGSTTPSTKLDVNGNINVGTGDGYEIGDNMVLYASSTMDVTFGGINAGATTIATASSTPTLTSGPFSTGFGYDALEFATSSSDTAVGYLSQQGTPGTAYNINAANTSVGSGALELALGFSNVAIGSGAEQNHTGSQNTVVGTNALVAAGTGFSNSVFGINAGKSVTTGSNNTFIGAFVASTTTTGSNNIALGYDIELPNTTGSNQLDIGNLLYGIGINGQSQNVSAGQIGIGSTSPFADLSIQANNASTNTVLFAIGSTTAIATTTLLQVNDDGSTVLNASSTNAALTIYSQNNGLGGEPYLTLQRGPGGANDFQVGAFGVTSIRGGAGGNTSLGVNTGVSTLIGEIVKGFTNQTADLEDWENSGGLVLADISAGGSLGIATTSPLAKLDVYGTINTDPTVGGYQIGDSLFATASSTNSSTLVGFGAGSALLASTSLAGNTAFGLDALEFATSSSYNTAIGYQALTQTSAGAGAGVGFNTAVGYQALTGTTIGNQNTAIGSRALSALTTGTQNIAIGYNALVGLTTNTANVAIGTNAGATNNNNYSSSVLIGNSAGLAKNLASSVAVGSSALSQDGGTDTDTVGIGGSVGVWINSSDSVLAGFSTGFGSSTAVGTAPGLTFTGFEVGSSTLSNYGYSSAYGYEAGGSLTTGAENTLLGSLAGQNITTGSNNIFLGYNTQATSTTEQNGLNIGDLIFGSLPATTSQTQSTLTYPTTGAIGIGSTSPSALLSLFANNGSTQTELFDIGSSTSLATTTLFSIYNSGNAYFAGNLGIGTNAPAYALDVEGAGNYINVSQYGGYKQAGNLILYASSTNSSTLVGQGAGINLLASTTLAGNSSFGFDALENATSSSYNTAMGYNALLGSPTISNTGSNTAVGYQTLMVDTSGIDNVAEGYNALASNTSGSASVAVGYNSLAKATTNTNTAVGFDSFAVLTTNGSDTGVGNNTGLNESGAFVTAVGANAVQFGNGSFETAIGSNAGQNLLGNDSTVVGYQAGAGLNGQTNTTGLTYVGFQAGSSTLSTSGFSTGIGYEAGGGGLGQITGSDNVSVGALAGENLTSGSNDISIGYNALATSSSAINALNIGNLIFGSLPATSSNTTLTYPTVGAVGIGSTSPFAEFGIAANNGSTNSTLFAIGSSTANSTTTLFSVSNSGNGYAAGYLSIGSVTPLNNSAGDITATQLNIGNTITNGDQFFTAGGTLTDTGNANGVFLQPGFNPSSANTGQLNGLNVNAVWSGSNNIAIGRGSQYINDFRNTGTVTNELVGFAGTGMQLSGNSNNFTGINQAIGAQAQGLLSFGNSVTGAVSNAIGFDVLPSSVTTQTLTNQAGVRVQGLFAGTNNTDLLLGQSTIPSGNYGIYDAATSSNYFAAKIGVGTSSPETTFTVIGAGCFSAGAGQTLACNQTAGNISYNTANTGGGTYDVAENYFSSDPTITPGTIVALNQATSSTVTTATTTANLFGIITTNPGLLLGGADASLNGLPVRGVALAGRVPTHISLQNGPIEVGDRITLSSIPGVGMKAGPLDPSVGIALENFDPLSTSSPSGACDSGLAAQLQSAGVRLGTNPCIASILVSIRPESGLASSNFVEEASSTDFSDLGSALGELADTAFTQGAQLIKVVAGELVAKVAVIGDLFANQITVNTLNVGSSTQPAGITLYDQVTKAPYCVSMQNGQLASTPGTCTAPTGPSQIINGNSNSTDTNAGSGTSTNASSSEASDNTSSGTSTATVAPTITLNGNNPATLNIGDSYADLGATVSDDGAGQAGESDLGYKIYVDGNPVSAVSLDTSTSTTYTIEYVATDSLGNTATSTRTVIVSSNNTSVADGGDATTTAPN